MNASQVVTKLRRIFQLAVESKGSLMADQQDEIDSITNDFLDAIAPESCGVPTETCFQWYLGPYAKYPEVIHAIKTTSGDVRVLYTGQDVKSMEGTWGPRVTEWNP